MDNIGANYSGKKCLFCPFSPEKCRNWTRDFEKFARNHITRVLSTVYVSVVPVILFLIK